MEGTNTELSRKMIIVFKWVRNMSRSKLISAEEGANGHGIEGIGVGGTGIEAAEFPDVGMQDFIGVIDDTWLNEILGSWSYDFVSK